MSTSTVRDIPAPCRRLARTAGCLLSLAAPCLLPSQAISAVLFDGTSTIVQEDFEGPHLNPLLDLLGGADGWQFALVDESSGNTRLRIVKPSAVASAQGALVSGFQAQGNFVASADVERGALPEQAFLSVTGGRVSGRVDQSALTASIDLPGGPVTGAPIPAGGDRYRFQVSRFGSGSIQSYASFAIPAQSGFPNLLAAATSLQDDGGAAGFTFALGGSRDAAGTPIPGHTNVGYLDNIDIRADSITLPHALHLARVVHDEAGASSLFGDVDASLPTVVVSHDFQPAGSPSSRYPLEEISDAVLATGIRLGDAAASGSGAAFTGFNVIEYEWREAFRAPDLYDDSARASYGDAAIGLIDGLKQLLGEDYAQSIHLIGHGLGSAVVATATANLPFDPAETQMTLLDTPSLTDLGIGFSPTWFQTTVAEGAATYVDNYYGVDDATSGGITAPTGTAIDGAAPAGGGRFFGADHHEVVTRYADGPVRSGPWTSAAALPGTFDQRSAPTSWRPPAPTLLDVGFSDDFSDWSAAAGDPQVADVLFDGISMTGMLLTEGGSESVDRLISFDADADVLAFQVANLIPGDGDSLRLTFDGELLWEVAGLGALLGELLDMTVPVGWLAGRDGLMTFSIAAAGDANAQFFLTDFQLYAADTQIEPVFEPVTLILVLIGLAGICLTRMPSGCARDAR